MGTAVAGPRTRALALAAALATTVPPSALALEPEQAIAQYALMKWGAGSLPGPGVRAIVQTPDHYLWLGTSAGLVRFDGASFVVHDSRTTPGFGDGGVASLVVGPTGDLFYGTTSGDVARVRDGRFVPVRHGAGPGVVCAMLAARDGSLWFSLYGRPVHRWSAGAVRSLSDSVEPLGPLAFLEDGRGAIWIGTENDGLVRAEGERFQSLPITRESVQAMEEDRDGALWLGTPHGLFRLREGRVDRYGRRDGLAGEDVSAILEDSDGNLWVGTSGGGLSRLTGGRWSSFTAAEGLLDDDVRSLLEDHEGNLWVGTADGLNCFSDTRFATFGRLEGLSDTTISSVALGARGVWVGTNKGSLFRLHGGRVETFPLPDRLGRENVIALHEQRDGGLWAALANNRLVRLHHGEITEYTPSPSPGVKGGRVTAFSEDEQGLFFHMKGYGLARLRGRETVPFAPALPDLDYVHAIHRDRRGVLWLAGALGLTRVAGTDVRAYTIADGLPKNRVRSISEDEGGSLWLATAGGLARLANDRIQALTVDHGLPENYLRLVLDDGRGFLWVASMGHVFRVSKREAADVLEGRQPRVFPVLFDTSDGLRTTEALLSNSPGVRDADGRLWFATTRGVSVVDPQRISVEEPAPPVRIERIVVDGRVERPGGAEALAYEPGRGQVSIDYTALRFRAVNRVRFRHRLKGLDDDWVDAGRRRNAYYSNLPPGDYTFAVTACNPYGVWNGGTVELPFTIRPPFHKTWPFYTVVAAGLGLMLAAAHRLRLNHLRARFWAILGERTRIARELHDTLAQGLAGTGIQLDAALSVLPREPEAAQEHVALGRAMVRSTLGEVRRSIWVLRTQTSKRGDGLGSVLSESLQQLTSDTRLVPRIRLTGEPRELAPEVERNLLRIAHEAVTNAVRHSGAETLEVELSFAHSAVHLRVRDDGRGFDPQPWLTRHRGDHFGLVGLVERVRGLGGELDVKSGAGLGTDIVCRLPYRAAP